MLGPTIYEWVSYARTILDVSRYLAPSIRLEYLHNRITSLAPVSSVMPTQDGQSYLVTTLDSHVRLMDATTGKMLNDFSGHKIQEYRCRSCFGHGEASVICGDENGMVWAWDLVDVSRDSSRSLSI